MTAPATEPTEKELADRLRFGLRAPLVEALESIPVLSDAVGRAQLREELTQRLGPLSLADQPTARLFYVELMRYCWQSPPDLLTELAESVRYLAPGERAVEQVQRLADEIIALSVEPALAPHWERLQRDLSMPLDRQIGLFFHEAINGRSPLPRHCDDVWAAFVFLVGQNTGRQHLPPWMQFLEILRENFDPDADAVARQFMRDLTKTWDSAATARTIGFTAQLEGLLVDRNRRPAVGPLTGVVSIEIAPDPIDADHYRVCTVQRLDGAPALQERHDGELVVRAALEAEVQTALARVERDWAAYSTDVHLQFVLPLPLLNEPVEWWSKEPGPIGVPLAVQHQVVVRSWERLRKREWHREWRKRWEHLQQEPARSTVMRLMAEREDHLRRLPAEVMTDPRCVGLRLSAPPDPQAGPVQELEIALRMGLPVVLWHRQPGIDGWSGLLDGEWDDLRLTDLPERLARLRREIESLPSTQRDAHPGRHLVLLWDDAARVPGLYPGPGRTVPEPEHAVGGVDVTEGPVAVDLRAGGGLDATAR